MSVVTNCILSMGCLASSDIEGRPSERDEVMEKVNRFFTSPSSGFVLVDDAELPRGWYGGTKMLECTLAIGAFNHLVLDGLIRHLKQMEWDNNDTIQLIVKGENDDRFYFIVISEYQ